MNSQREYLLSTKYRHSQNTGPRVADKATESKIDDFKGPYVVVKVEDHDFELPKRLLCSNSKFFNTAFMKPNFKEGVQQVLKLPGCTITVFQLVIKWVYTGEIILPAAVTEDKAEAFTLGVSFFTTADRIDLLGPFNSIIAQLKNLILSSPNIIEGGHIRSAALLPKRHPLRELLAQACVKPYLSRKIDGCGKGCGQGFELFKFQTEVGDLESFSSDLLRALEQLYAAQRLGPVSRLDHFTGVTFKHWY